MSCRVAKVLEVCGGGGGHKSLRHKSPLPVASQSGCGPFRRSRSRLGERRGHPDDTLPSSTAEIYNLCVRRGWGGILRDLVVLDAVKGCYAEKKRCSTPWLADLKFFRGKSGFVILGPLATCGARSTANIAYTRRGAVPSASCGRRRIEGLRRRWRPRRRWRRRRGVLLKF